MKFCPKISNIGYKVTDSLYKKTASLANKQNSVSAKKNISRLSDGLLRSRESFDVHTCERRLPPKESLIAFTDTLGEINSQLELLSFDLSGSTNSLQNGSLKVFEKEYLVTLEKRVALLMTLQEKIRSISSLLGFSSEKEQKETQTILGAFCEATGADSAVMQFGLISPINIFHGFTPYEANLLRNAQPSKVFNFMKNKTKADTEFETRHIEQTLKRFHIEFAIDAEWMMTNKEAKHQIDILLFSHKNDNPFNIKMSDMLPKVFSSTHDPLINLYDSTMESCQPTNLQLSRARHDSGVNEIKNLYYPKTMGLRKFVEMGSKESLLREIMNMSNLLPLSIARTSTWKEIIRDSDVYKKTDITPLLRETVMNYRSRIQQKGIKFSFLIPGEAVSVIGNNAIFQRLIDNLMDNALKYTERGNIIFNAEIQTEKRKPNKRNLVIEVIDTGIGIPKKDLANLYKRDYRASNVGEIEGTGTGLAYVREAVSGLLGQIDVDSKEGKGSTFTLTFPIVEK